MAVRGPAGFEGPAGKVLLKAGESSEIAGVRTTRYKTKAATFGGKKGRKESLPTGGYITSERKGLPKGEKRYLLTTRGRRARKVPLAAAIYAAPLMQGRGIVHWLLTETTVKSPIHHRIS